MWTFARLAGEVVGLPTEADDLAPPLLRAGACTNVWAMGMLTDIGADTPLAAAWLSPADARRGWTLPPAPAAAAADADSWRCAAAACAADVTRLADVSRSPPPYDRARSSALPAPYSASLGVGLQVFPATR